MSVRAADDFDAIRSRRDELRAEEAKAKKRCKGGCGEPLGRVHQPGCTYSGSVVEGETA